MKKRTFIVLGLLLGMGSSYTYAEPICSRYQEMVKERRQLLDNKQMVLVERERELRQLAVYPDGEAVRSHILQQLDIHKAAIEKMERETKYDKELMNVTLQKNMQADAVKLEYNVDGSYRNAPIYAPILSVINNANISTKLRRGYGETIKTFPLYTLRNNGCLTIGRDTEPIRYKETEEIGLEFVGENTYIHNAEKATMNGNNYDNYFRLQGSKNSIFINEGNVEISGSLRSQRIDTIEDSFIHNTKTGVMKHMARSYGGSIYYINDGYAGSAINIGTHSGVYFVNTGVIEQGGYSFSHQIDLTHGILSFSKGTVKGNLEITAIDYNDPCYYVPSKEPLPAPLPILVDMREATMEGNIRLEDVAYRMTHGWPEDKLIESFGYVGYFPTHPMHFIIDKNTKITGKVVSETPNMTLVLTGEGTFRDEETDKYQGFGHLLVKGNWTFENVTPTFSETATIDGALTLRKGALTTKMLSIPKGNDLHIDGDVKIEGAVHHQGNVHIVHNTDDFTHVDIAEGYTGDAGTLDMNINIDAEPKADRVSIKGATAGITTVNLINQGETLAQPLSQRVKLIETGADSTGKFVLGVKKYGKYAFGLKPRKEEEGINWYLCRIMNSKLGVIAANDKAAKNLFQLSLADRGSLGSQDRDADHSTWAKAVLGHSQFGIEDVELYGESTIHTKSDAQILQLGHTLYDNKTERSRTVAGIFASYGKQHTTAEEDGDTSHGQAIGYNVGVYGTYFRDHWYVVAGWLTISSVTIS